VVERSDTTGNRARGLRRLDPGRLAHASSFPTHARSESYRRHVLCDPYRDRFTS